MADAVIWHDRQRFRRANGKTLVCGGRAEGKQRVAYQSIFREGLFAGQVIIVTGGGSGIGRCTAHELAALGATVALLGRKPDKLASVAAEIAEDGGRTSTHPCDIREEEAVKAAIAAILKLHGRIDGLVNNAGGQFQAPLEAISQKGWETDVRTNLTGGFLMARECYTQWMRAHGGAIVNVVADMWNGMPGMGHSGAARAGMVNLTMTAAAEWGASGVRVNAVAPGWIASSGFDTYPDSVKPMLRSLRRHTPLQRYGTEAEVSAAIVFLLSPAAAFISGETLRVDGAAPNAKRHVDLEAHDRSKPWNGFHRSVLPKLLQDK
jgi:citronellol/citronellal dehydrogenase